MSIGTVKLPNRLPTEEEMLQNTFIDENQALAGYAFVINSILSGQGGTFKGLLRRIIDQAQPLGDDFRIQPSCPDAVDHLRRRTGGARRRHRFTRQTKRIRQHLREHLRRSFALEKHGPRILLALGGLQQEIRFFGCVLSDRLQAFRRR